MGPDTAHPLPSAAPARVTSQCDAGSADPGLRRLARTECGLPKSACRPSDCGSTRLGAAQVPPILDYARCSMDRCSLRKTGTMIPSAIVVKE
jgi:hypothetical protein